jgi:two-component system cell cycle sensor histidine kinase/response regulator CckA
LILLERRHSGFATGNGRLKCLPGIHELNMSAALNILERDQADAGQLHTLAAFARCNPNAVLALDHDANVTYANEAAFALARLLSKDHPQHILPLNTANIVRLCLSTGQNRLRLESPIADRRISWSFFPLPAERVVHCYAEDLTESQNLEAQLRETEKMDSMGQFAAGLAHDFNNILTVMQGHAMIVLSSNDLAQEVAESVRQISQAAERAANLTQQLLTFSRRRVMQPQLLDLNVIINSTSKTLQSLLGDAITLQRNLSPRLPSTNGDPGMIEQVLVNLAANGRDAMKAGGTLTIATFMCEIGPEYVLRHPEAREGCFVGFSVSDAGAGIDPGTLLRIFEPFFATRGHGRGAGLSLAAVYGIVRQHQGWIEVSSEPRVGTTFKVFLPASERPAETRQSGRQNDLRGGDETILVVEDEAPLRELVKELLEQNGYKVLEASSGAHALEMWQQHGRQVDLVLTDIMMPGGISGRQLGERLLSERPDLKVIYTSGYSLEVAGQDFVLESGVDFLQKPYQPDTLARVVRECLDRGRN